MKSNKGWSWAGAGVAVASLLGGALFACSNSSSSPTLTCVTSALGSGCTSCIQSNCGSQFSTASSACSSLVSCVCPNGQYNSNDLQSCGQNAPTSCQNAFNDVVACAQHSCASQCSGSGSGSGGSGGGSCQYPSATTSCANGGFACDSTHCCPSSTPYGCISTMQCYASESAAASACGSSCIVCGATGPSSGSGSGSGGGSCTPNTAPNNCSTAGDLPCNTSVCCPSTTPFACPSTSRCYATASAAAAACGGSPCYACGP